MTHKSIITFKEKWQGRNFIKEIRAEQQASKEKKPKAVHKKLIVKHI